MSALASWLPTVSFRVGYVVLRNLLVLRYMIGSNFACLVLEALVILYGFGLGIGSLVGDVQDTDYIVFVASAIAVFSTSHATVFEALDAVHTRFAVQRTWESMLLAPLRLSDLVLGELLWCALKATTSGLVVLLLACISGYLEFSSLIYVIPAVFLGSLAYGSFVLCYAAICRNYDQHEYYYAIVQFPMVMLSGLFFPRDVMPQYLQSVSEYLPLTKLVELVRPLALGEIPANLFALIGYQILLLIVMTVIAYRLFVRRIYQ